MKMNKFLCIDCAKFLPNKKVKKIHELYNEDHQIIKLGFKQKLQEFLIEFPSSRMLKCWGISVIFSIITLHFNIRFAIWEICIMAFFLPLILD